MAQQGKKTGSVNKAESKKEPKNGKRERPDYTVYIVSTIAIVTVVAAVLLLLPKGFSGVSFSSFKQNFGSASRVALVSYYHNASTYAAETVCATDLIEIISAHRPPSSIDFYTIDNSSCTYLPNGLGKPGNVNTTSASSCLSKAASEPSISLNYSAANQTSIQAYHLAVYGNVKYMESCPIAAEFS